MRKSIITKILLSRRLYQLSLENLNSDNELSLSIGVILLQDSVEVFLLAVAEHIDAGIGDKSNFNQYFDLINKKISPKELPFKFRLNSLNKLRVNAKHCGLSPSKSETTGLIETVKEFFEEVSLQVFEKEFVTISLVDLINKGEAKDYLMAAENDFSKGDYVNVLINCRKAIYVEIEADYDISSYIDESERKGILGIMLAGYKAPFYARNKKYIDEKVKEPTDFIVYDHDNLDMDLLRSGMSRLDYWNVWRLTPSLYRKDSKSDWIVKEEFRKLDEEGIKDRAEYVLDSTINLILTKHLDLKRSKTPDYKKYYVNLKNESALIYEKADNKSKVVGTVSADCKKVFVDSKVSALNGEGFFWHVVHIEDGFYLYGYIDNDDI
jgi:hypothetical protein